MNLIPWPASEPGSQPWGTLASDLSPKRNTIDHRACIVVREETWGLFVVPFQGLKREGIQEVAALTFVLEGRVMGGVTCGISCQVILVYMHLLTHIWTLYHRLNHHFQTQGFVRFIFICSPLGKWSNLLILKANTNALTAEAPEITTAFNIKTWLRMRWLRSS